MTTRASDAGPPGTSTPGSLAWPKLLQGVLISRYKRFMADVKLRNGRTVTAHCPNSGSMRGCSEPGRTVYLSRESNPRRRLTYTWQMIEMPGSLVGVNTNVPNRLTREAVIHGAIPSLAGYASVRTEVKYGANSRIDLLLEDDRVPPCYVEVKNCTLVEDRIGYFPDAVTARGLKHLMELAEQVRLGRRGVMFFLIQRMDADLFRPADHIDLAYGRALREVSENGVEILVYDVRISLGHIALGRKIPFEL